MYPVLVTPIVYPKTMGQWDLTKARWMPLFSRLLLGIVSPHGPPFSKIVESTSDGIDGPWIVAHIGQGGMVDDWWQSTPG